MAKSPGKTADVVDVSEPPFSSGGSTVAGKYSGAHNFLTDPKSGAPAGGGRDFSKESRSTADAKLEVVPNPQEIPASGKILKADPGPVSKTVAGSAPGPQPRKPFKV